MTVKRWCSKLAAAVVLLVAVAGSVPEMYASGADTNETPKPRYIQRIVSRETLWSKLMPRILTVQYAGGIGMFSVGPGWEYGRSKQWETHLMIGFTPKRYNYHTYWTLTLREIYNPWQVDINGKWRVRPLSVIFGINSILHNDFWTREPDRYPSGYYGFSSRVRFHLGVGQRFTFIVPEQKRFMSSRLSVYYEVSTCDLYVRQKMLNKDIPLKDIITLGVGLQWAI